VGVRVSRTYSILGRDSQEKKIIEKIIEKLIEMEFCFSDMSQLLQFLHFPSLTNLNKFFNKFFNNFFTKFFLVNHAPV